MESKSKIVYVAFVPVLLVLVGFFVLTGENQATHESEPHTQDENHSDALEADRSNFVILNANEVRQKTSEVDVLELKIGDEIIDVPRIYEQRYSVNYDFAETGAQIYKDLSEMARNGDALAARELGQQLGICKESFRDRESLNKEIESINRSFEAGNLDDRRFEQGNYVSVVRKVKYIQERFELCESLDDKTLNEEIEFYEIASDLGDYAAAELLAAEYDSREDWDNLHKVSLELWRNHGGAPALNNLVFLYSSNKVQPPRDLLAGQSIDVLIHAINIVALETFFESVSSRYPDDIQSVLPRTDVDASLSDTSQVLSPSEHAAAEQMAIDLLRDNENCCRTSF